MSYRDDLETLSSRREALRAELDDAERKADQLRAEVDRRERVARELRDVEARLEKRGALKRSPLDDIRIGSPCDKRWEDMVGDDRKRFCEACQKNVYDLSAMAREEAERFLMTHEETPCVRLYRRPDGTVMSADCPEGRRKIRRRLAVLSAVGAGAMAAGVMSAWPRHTCSTAHADRERIDLEPGDVLGDVAYSRDLVEVPLSPRRDPSIVAIFWHDQRGPSTPAGRIVVYADRRVVREVDAPAPHTVIAETRLSPTEAEPLFTLASQFRARATGVVSDHDDSAVHQGFDLHGRGAEPMTPRALDRLRFMGGVLERRLAR